MGDGLLLGFVQLKTLEGLAGFEHGEGGKITSIGSDELTDHARHVNRKPEQFTVNVLIGEIQSRQLTVQNVRRFKTRVLVGTGGLITNVGNETGFTVTEFGTDHWKSSLSSASWDRAATLTRRTRPIFKDGRCPFSICPRTWPSDKPDNWAKRSCVMTGVAIRITCFCSSTVLHSVTLFFGIDVFSI